jgi:hypothetical protein
MHHGPPSVIRFVGLQCATIWLTVKDCDSFVSEFMLIFPKIYLIIKSIRKSNQFMKWIIK